MAGAGCPHMTRVMEKGEVGLNGLCLAGPCAASVVWCALVGPPHADGGGSWGRGRLMGRCMGDGEGEIWVWGEGRRVEREKGESGLW